MNNINNNIKYVFHILINKIMNYDVKNIFILTIKKSIKQGIMVKKIFLLSG